MEHDVVVFKPYPFTVGQKIRIENTRRAGDWLVVAIGENSVTLQCPISQKEFEWSIFCYSTEVRKQATWPQKD